MLYRVYIPLGLETCRQLLADTQATYFIILSIILELFFFTGLIFNAIPSVEVLVLVSRRAAEFSAVERGRVSA